jgi:hypothetical protein
MIIGLLKIQFAKHPWLTKSDPLSKHSFAISTESRICLSLTKAFRGFKIIFSTDLLILLATTLAINLQILPTLLDRFTRNTYKCLYRNKVTSFDLPAFAHIMHTRDEAITKLPTRSKFAVFTFIYATIKVRAVKLEGGGEESKAEILKQLEKPMPSK